MEHKNATERMLAMLQQGGPLPEEIEENDISDEGDEGDDESEEQIPQLTGSVSMINISADTPTIATSVPTSPRSVPISIPQNTMPVSDNISVSIPGMGGLVNIPSIPRINTVVGTPVMSFLAEPSISLLPMTTEVKQVPFTLQLLRQSSEPSPSIASDIQAAYSKMISVFDTIATGSGTINILYAKMLVDKIWTRCGYTAKEEEIMNGYFMRMPDLTTSTTTSQVSGTPEVNIDAPSGELVAL